MIPAPDLTLYWIMGLGGIGIAFIGGIIGGFEKGFPITMVGLISGLTILIVALSGSVGFTFMEDNESLNGQWKLDITKEIEETECEDLKALSFEYKKSKIDAYTINLIRDEIEESYIFNCVETRDDWWS